MRVLHKSTTAQHKHPKPRAHRRPARWSRPSAAHGPAQTPGGYRLWFSRDKLQQGRHFDAAAILPELPPALWHLSVSAAHTVLDLHTAGGTLTWRRAVHPSGCVFLLAYLPDGLAAAVAPMSQASLDLLYEQKGHDSTGWARAQSWL